MVWSHWYKHYMVWYDMVWCGVVPHGMEPLVKPLHPTLALSLKATHMAIEHT